MKLFLTILACLVAASAGAQTIKTLGYNTTNGNIVAATNVTFTNSVGFATNARAATRTNLGGTAVGNAVFTATNAAAAASAIGLGTTNEVRFDTVITRGLFDAVTNEIIDLENNWLNYPGFGAALEWSDTANTTYVPFAFGGTNASINAATTRTNLGLGATWLTNSASPLFWTNVPASPTNSGTAGQVAYTNNYLYICISNNTWRRVQLGTW